MSIDDRTAFTVTSNGNMSLHLDGRYVISKSFIRAAMWHEINPSINRINIDNIISGQSSLSPLLALLAAPELKNNMLSFCKAFPSGTVYWSDSCCILRLMHYTKTYLSRSGWEITDWHRVTKEQALLYNDEYQLIRPAI